MKLAIDHTHAALKKRRFAILVTSITSTIIATTLLAASTLKSSDIFGAIPKEHVGTEEVSVLK